MVLDWNKSLMRHRELNNSEAFIQNGTICLSTGMIVIILKTWPYRKMVVQSSFVTVSNHIEFERRNSCFNFEWTKWNGYSSKTSLCKRSQRIVLMWSSRNHWIDRSDILAINRSISSVILLFPVVEHHLDNVSRIKS